MRGKQKRSTCISGWYLPHAVHRRRWTRRKSSWLWWTAWRFWFPWSPHKPSRRQCSPRWTPRPGTLWRGTVRLGDRGGECKRLVLIQNDYKWFIYKDSSLVVEVLLWLDSSLSNDSFHVWGSSSFHLQKEKKGKTPLGKTNSLSFVQSLEKEDLSANLTSVCHFSWTGRWCCDPTFVVNFQTKPSAPLPCRDSKIKRGC